MESSSKEFTKVSKKFTKRWSSKKGPCPHIEKVLAVVNPALEDSLKDYKKTLPFWHSKTKNYFHGTKFKCQLDLYQTPCNGHRSTCGICGISTDGFQHKFIRERWQRYGQGFYFAPNSSKSNDYCSNPADVEWKAMFLCQVAPGKKHFTRKNLTDLEGPPKGYNSVYGKSKTFLLNSVLNYDELAVFTSAAACPRYVLLYRK